MLEGEGTTNDPITLVMYSCPSIHNLTVLISFGMTYVSLYRLEIEII